MQWSSELDRGSAEAGQFATPEWVAELLTSRLCRSPSSIADLGIGKGALTLACAKRFPSSKLIGVDRYAIPTVARSILNNAGVELSRFDVASPRFVSKFKSKYGLVDSVVCNPPFTYILNTPQSRAILTKENFRASSRVKCLRLDLYFLAQARKLLTQQGEMAFILPISAFSMANTLPNLLSMSKHFGLYEIVKLPRNSYLQAEVDTAILVFRPNGKRQNDDRFAVFSATAEKQVEKIGYFSAQLLIDELGMIGEAQRTASNSLAALGVTVARGRHSSRLLSANGISHFHTTSFQDYPGSQVAFESARTSLDLEVPAREGDILISRVGTRCLGRSAIVVRGERPISDCVFRLSSPPATTRKVWEFISSESGRLWQLGLARGACAKFIPQVELMSTPLPIPLR
jgi:tRNA1(Val) A37 N6-methylase TrmN6